MANHEGHEGHEAHEIGDGQPRRRSTDGPHSSWHRMRLPSPLSPEAEVVMTETRAQVISYLKTTGLRGGLLINFRAPTLRQGLQRIVV
jgi:PD-(D/E)XK nuclease superfamily